MSWTDAAVICMVLVNAIHGINRPVYKVVLTQKGFTQFLQYDLETPPLREFTFCTWIRIYDLEGDQSIFTYVANGNNRIVRLLLHSGGRYMEVSIDERVTWKVPVDIIKDVWRHVCLSYQSDYGALALYIDAKLISCEVAQSLYGLTLPRGGSIILGYGTAHDGASNGLEGEVFGANMILASTIEQNHTATLKNFYDKITFQQNRIKGSDKNIKYIILGDLQTDEVHNNFEKTQLPRPNKTPSYIKLKTPYSFIEHDVGLDLSSKNIKEKDVSNEMEILDFHPPDTMRTTSENSQINFWNLVNQAGHEGKFKIQKKTPHREIFESSTRDLATISEYETPPPPPATNHAYLEKNYDMEKSYNPLIFNSNQGSSGFKKQNVQGKNKPMDFLPDIETPPAIDKDTKVYGQWTSSKFAGSVLNYLKSINFHTKDKKPSIIPKSKFSDSYPYASDFKLTKLRPPVQFQRRNIVDRNVILKKRGLFDKPQINVQIIKDDFRSEVLKQHAQTEPKNVEVTHRGDPARGLSRYYRNVENLKESSESVAGTYKLNLFKVPSVHKKSKTQSDYESYKNKNLMTIMPFLKSLQYFVKDSQDLRSGGKEDTHSNKLSNTYSKRMTNANKWHNVKSYSNDYTPHHLNIDLDEDKSQIEVKVGEKNNKHPTLRLKYKHDSHKLKDSNEDPTILKGRHLAMTVSDQSKSNRELTSMFKYNRGFLPSNDKRQKNLEKILAIPIPDNNSTNGKSNFNKHVKLGNALNERQVIGYNERQKKQSFIGGDENIPDINRYRSDLDNENRHVPSSLGLRVCTNFEEDRDLYIHPDLSIGSSPIVSPVKKNNAGIEFIQQNYRKCSLDGSTFAENSLLFIDWSKTPVRLFGGAYPKKTTDLCGFFK